MVTGFEDVDAEDPQSFGGVSTRFFSTLRAMSGNQVLELLGSALAELMDAQVRRDPGADEDLEEAARQLRDAVGLEERH